MPPVRPPAGRPRVACCRSAGRPRVDPSPTGQKSRFVRGGEPHAGQKSRFVRATRRPAARAAGNASAKPRFSEPTAVRSGSARRKEAASNPDKTEFLATGRRPSPDKTEFLTSSRERFAKRLQAGCARPPPAPAACPRPSAPASCGGRMRAEADAGATGARRPLAENSDRGPSAAPPRGRRRERARTPQAAPAAGQAFDLRLCEGRRPAAPAGMRGRGPLRRPLATSRKPRGGPRSEFPPVRDADRDAPRRAGLARIGVSSRNSGRRGRNRIAFVSCEPHARRAPKTPGALTCGFSSGVESGGRQAVKKPRFAPMRSPDARRSRTPARGPQARRASLPPAGRGAHGPGKPRETRRSQTRPTRGQPRETCANRRRPGHSRRPHANSGRGAVPISTPRRFVEV